MRTSTVMTCTLRRPVVQGASRGLPVCRARAIDATDRVVVAGGGIGGLATALALTRCEIPVMVLERSEGLRQEGTSLGLLANAWRALDALSIGDELRKANPRVTGGQFLTAKGVELNTFRLEDSESDTEMRGVMRRRLLQTLSDQLAPECIQFNSHVTSLDLTNSDRPLLTLEDGRQMRCRVVVGADGEKSRTASALGLPPTEYCGNAAVRGVSEFDELPIPRQTINYFVGNGTRSGMYQVEENKLYWFISFNAPETIRVKNMEALLEKTKQLSLEFGEAVHACVENVIPGCLSFAKLSDRLGSPFQPPGKGTITLVGDAFHPMTPNLGQGAALALEDSVVLGRQLKSVGGLEADDQTVCTALRRYEMERLQRAVPMTLRSRLAGNLFSIPYSPVVSVRNALLSNVNLGKLFVNTARYDCGALM